MSDEIKLLPCPHCGGQVEQYMYLVLCDTCGMRTSMQDSNKVADAWNRRASPWVDCKDRLPKDGELVVVGYNDKSIGLLGYWDGWEGDFTPVKWMPIPPMEGTK
ncbi:MAG: hypothetical protein AAB899_04045 [Patescibacteria group bacterium]